MGFGISLGEALGITQTKNFVMGSADKSVKIAKKATPDFIEHLTEKTTPSFVKGLGKKTTPKVLVNMIEGETKKKTPDSSGEASATTSNNYNYSEGCSLYKTEDHNIPTSKEEVVIYDQDYLIQAQENIEIARADVAEAKKILQDEIFKLQTGTYVDGDYMKAYEALQNAIARLMDAENNLELAQEKTAIA